MLRLSVTYALLDSSPEINVDHVTAAYWLWGRAAVTSPEGAPLRYRNFHQRVWHRTLYVSDFRSSACTSCATPLRLA
jgi:hypothetical protein